jgi:hypothetical protein
MCPALQRLLPDPLSRRHGVCATARHLLITVSNATGVNGLRRQRIARGASATLDGEASLTDSIVVAPGTASVLKAEDLRVAAGRSSTLRNLPARHEQALSARARQSAACNASHSVHAHLSRLLLCARSVRQRRY